MCDWHHGTHKRSIGVWRLRSSMWTPNNGFVNHLLGRGGEHDDDDTDGLLLNSMTTTTRVVATRTGRNHSFGGNPWSSGSVCGCVWVSLSLSLSLSPVVVVEGAVSLWF